MLNARSSFCTSRLRPVAWCGLIVVAIWLGVPSADDLRAQDVDAQKAAFLKRVKEDDFDELVLALGNRLVDHTVIFPSSRPRAAIGPPSLYHSILSDYRVAKIRSLIAAMPESERGPAAELIFDRKIEELEHRLRALGDGKRPERDEEPFGSTHATCAVGAALILCGEFCPVSSTLDKLEYTEKRLRETAALLPHLAAADRARLFPGGGFDPLLEINLLLHVLNQRYFVGAEIESALTRAERKNLWAGAHIVWDLRKNEPIQSFPSNAYPGVALRWSAYSESPSDDLKSQQDLIRRLQSILRKSEPEKPGSVPKADAK